MATQSELSQGDSQDRVVCVQVMRGGSWLTVPVSSIKATRGKGTAGSMSLSIPEDPTDPARSQIYEGEPVRAFRGSIGSPLKRSWTGFADVREGTIDATSQVMRNVTVSDYIKELNDSIMLTGRIYDNLPPMQAIADLVQQAMDTQQFQPFNDDGSIISSVGNYASGGSAIAHFPTIFNDDQSLYRLAAGTTASFTKDTQLDFASFMVPTPASFQSYCTYQLPHQYVIGSTMVIGSGQTAQNAPYSPAKAHGSLPPAAGTFYFDEYNATFYFNPADSGATCVFNAAYYDSPLFSYPQGTSVGSTIAAIAEHAGCLFNVSVNGQLYCRTIDYIRAPRRILNRGSYVQTGIQISRDRRNVVVALGFDGNCGEILSAIGVSYDDATLLPPLGLGKRAFLVASDRAWHTQYAVTQACWIALQQIGRRGRIASMTIIDDPDLDLDDILVFEGDIDEVSPANWFYIAQIAWNFDVSARGVNVLSQISGNQMPGEGIFYISPCDGVTSDGSLDLLTIGRPLLSATLVPAGGKSYSTFSIAGGLSYNYLPGPNAFLENIDVYGSDNTHVVFENNIVRPGGVAYTLPIPTSSFVPGVTYTLRHWVQDSEGAVAIYFTFITARA